MLDDLRKDELADVFVAPELEREGAELRVIVGGDLDPRLLVLGVMADEVGVERVIRFPLIKGATSADPLD